MSVEDFGGSGTVAGFDETQTTLSYQQPIELGGKRQARISLAQREREAAYARGIVARLDLLEEVQRAYSDALAAQAAAGLAKERLDVAIAFEKELGRRIAAARDPEFAGARATATTAEARLALEQATLAAEAARARLASYWAGSADIRLDAGYFANTTLPVRAEGGLLADSAMLEAERNAADARVDVEKSKAYRDPTFDVGVRHFARNDDVALVIGGSIPLNLFDDNSGAVDRAAAEHRAAGLDLAAYERGRERELARLHAQLRMAVAEIREIDSSVIPAAKRAVKLVREGFGRGAFAYLDVVGAQNGLSDAKTRRIAALQRFHTDKAAYERLLCTYATRFVMESRP